MSNVTFEITLDNTELIKQATTRQIMRALEKCGMEMENFAKINITNNGNADTGLLRNSITWAIDGKVPHTKSYKGGKSTKEGRKNDTSKVRGVI